MNFNICKKCNCIPYLTLNAENKIIVICISRNKNNQIKMKSTYECDNNQKNIIEKIYKKFPINICEETNNDINFLSKITSLVKENCTCFAEQLIDSYSKGK